MSVRESGAHSGPIGWALAAATMGIPLVWIGAQVADESLYGSSEMDHGPQGRASTLAERRSPHEFSMPIALNQGKGASTTNRELSSAGPKSHRRLDSHAPLLTSVLPY